MIERPDRSWQFVIVSYHPVTDRGPPSEKGHPFGWTAFPWPKVKADMIVNLDCQLNGIWNHQVKTLWACL